MSKLQDKFLEVWTDLGPTGYALQSEYAFTKERRWRFDFVLLTHRIAIELEGLAGRHQRTGGFLKDMEKYNTATVLGWRILRFSSGDLGSAVRQEQTIETIENLILHVERRALRATSQKKKSAGALPGT